MILARRRSFLFGVTTTSTISLCFLSAVFGSPDKHSVTPKVDFGRDIQPILANNCFECHGSDAHARKAGLRLDTFDCAKRVLAPGSSGKSRLVSRITAEEATRMPPASSGKRLTAAQVALVKTWIDQGAKYAEHWSFVPPRRPSVPKVSNPAWPKNPVDNFVLARLDRENLRPSPPADRATLLRRVYLDLTGLIPSPKEVREFLADNRPDAYERIVDRLLASPHYGERWARRWLDIARYADTNGYEKDRERSIWPYRDWVINAFNSGMPFDRFTVEQLAGDLLPNATQDQNIATGFHRNTMANEEGGIDLAEDRFKSMIDRTNTTGAAWLGMTVGCAQCHNHKFDPISQREYYGLFAFLNNTDEVEADVVTPGSLAKRTEIQRKIDAVETHRADRFPGGHAALDAKVDDWIKTNRLRAARWQVVKTTSVVSQNHATMTVLPDGSILASGDKPNTDTYEIIAVSTLPRITAIRVEALTDPSLPDGGPGRAHFFQRGGFLLSELGVEARSSNGGAFTPIRLIDPSADFEGGGRTVSQCLDGKLDTGWAITGQEGKDHRAVFQLAQPMTHAGGTIMKVRMDQFFVHQVILGRFRISVTDQALPVRAAPFPADVEKALATDVKTPDSRSIVKSWILRTVPEMEPVNAEIASLRKQMPAYPTSLVMRERPAGWERVTHIHQRGEYLKPTEVALPITPKLLPPFPSDGPRNRLGLAKWLVSPKNPLTARVQMNRDWQAFFGRGIVPTVEDFGTRGENPSHPELLDWLATEFMQGGWRMKRMHRLIVTSATYRQVARTSPELQRRDPLNILLARGPRFRVDAELVRDIALSASGLLNPKLGGPSVFPPQPAEVTGQVYGGYQYPTSTGPDRYRRGLYTYWKRTAPFAAVITFDGPTSENACMRRVRSNTPLQALTVMNDEVFVEAAEALAGRVVREGGQTLVDRIEYLYLCTLSRLPMASETAKVKTFYERQLQRFAGDSANAKTVARRYRSETGEGSEPELAAWTLTARAILNLDETITKQ